MVEWENDDVVVVGVVVVVLEEEFWYWSLGGGATLFHTLVSFMIPEHGTTAACSGTQLILLGHEFKIHD
jgi:hypothetical protein